MTSLVRHRSVIILTSVPVAGRAVSRGESISAVFGETACGSCHPTLSPAGASALQLLARLVENLATLEILV